MEAEPVLGTAEAVQRDYDRLRSGAGRLALPEVALIALRGEDRKGWLQGQITNDLKRLPPGGSLPFCLCSPTGQLLAICRLWDLPDRYLIATDRHCMAALRRRVEEMVIMEDVDLDDLSDSHELSTVQGPEASDAVRERFKLPLLDAAEHDLDGRPLFLLRSDRTGSGGWDLWKPADRDLEWTVPELSPEALEVARLEAGVPLFGVDATERTLPPELGPAFEAAHISYSKGCYTGQEVLMRIHSRGHTNRTWVGLVADGPLERGAVVEHPSRRDAGSVTSAAFSPAHGHIGAAMLRNEAAAGGELVRVQTQRGEVEAEVVRMPILQF
jgi:tRNA-modifying protein YgfZ